MVDKEILNNPEAFLNFFNNYVLLLDTFLKEYETYDTHSKKLYLNRLKNLIVVLCYLRGEHFQFLIVTRIPHINYYYQVEKKYLNKLQEIEKSLNINSQPLINL